MSVEIEKVLYLTVSSIIIAMDLHSVYKNEYRWQHLISAICVIGLIYLTLSQNYF